MPIIRGMTGGRPTGSHTANRIRLGLFLVGLLLLIPATGQAALTDLFDPLSQDLPVASTIVSTPVQPLSVPQVIDMVEETLPPPIEIVDEVVDQIEEVLVPPVEPPPVDLPDVVDPPGPHVFGGETFEFESNDFAMDDLSAGLESNDVLGDRVTNGQASQDGLDGLERSILTMDPAGSIATINPNSSPADTGWLLRLKAWLPPILAGLVDVLAAPVELLWLLFRALLSSGKWLIAPASLLVALAFLMFVDRNERSLSSMRRELADTG